MTPNSTSGGQTSALTNSLVSTQSNQSPNPCALSATNGLVNQSAVTSSLNPLLGVYEAGLSKEQLQQLQMEISKQNQQQFLNLKNGNSAASFLEQQHSSTPVSFNNSNNSSATGLAHPTQTPPPNGTSTNAQSTESKKKEQFYLDTGIYQGYLKKRYLRSSYLNYLKLLYVVSKLVEIHRNLSRLVKWDRSSNRLVIEKKT